MHAARMIMASAVCTLLSFSELDAQTTITKPKQSRLKIEHRQADRTMSVLKQLNQVVPFAEFDATPFDEALDWFRQQGLKNILVHWKQLEALADINPATPLTLKLTDLTLGELLDFVLDQVSNNAYEKKGRLFYRIRNGVIEISNRAAFAGEILVRTYDVEYLLQRPIIYKSAPTVELSGRGGKGGQGGSTGSGSNPGGNSIFEGGNESEGADFGTIRDDQMRDLVALLKSVRPLTWKENNGPGTISAFKGKLIISQTIEMHEIIGGKFEEIVEVRRHQEPGE